MARDHASPRVNGRAVRKRRQECELTATELAAKVKISRPYLSQIENGHRPTMKPATFGRLVRALKVERATLLVPDPEVPPLAPVRRRATRATRATSTRRPRAAVEQPAAMECDAA